MGCIENINNIKAAIARGEAIQVEADDDRMINQRLIQGARNGDVSAIRSAIAQGAYLESRMPWKLGDTAKDQDGGVVPTPTAEGLTPLMHSVQAGCLAGVELLLDARASVSACDEDGWQPLHFAAAAADVDACRLLIKYGACRSARDDDGKMPLHHVPSEHLAKAAERRVWDTLLGPEAEEPHRLFEDPYFQRPNPAQPVVG